MSHLLSDYSLFHLLIKFNVFSELVEEPDSAKDQPNALQLYARLKPFLQDLSLMFCENVRPHLNHNRLSAVEKAYMLIVSTIETPSRRFRARSEKLGQKETGKNENNR